MAGQRRELARADAGLADAAAAAAALQGGHVALQAAIVNELKVRRPQWGWRVASPSFPQSNRAQFAQHSVCTSAHPPAHGS